ncbi:MAG: phospholipase D-like domain-containing protein [Lactobacillaceae bacterium]|nr:phospholipase D-like domain-containing protein [Lactobacillaceae bacterium]
MPQVGSNNRIDNQEHTMREAIAALLSNPDVEVMDIASGYFRLSGISTLKNEIRSFMSQSLQKPKMRWLLSNRLDEKSSKFFDDAKENDDNEDFQISDDFFEQIKSWIKSGDIEVNVFVGKEYIESNKLNDIEFLHGKAYLFSAKHQSTSGHVLIGSSNFTQGGLVGNRELNIYSQDSWPALHSWFDELWDGYSVPYSNELLAAFEDQKKNAKQEVEYTPIDFMYWNLGKFYGKSKNRSLDRRIAELERKLPYPTDESGHKFFAHQRIGIKSVYEKLNEFDTQILADGVGLGKTLEAASILKLYLEDLEIMNDKRGALVLANDRLKAQWFEELQNVHQEQSKIHFMTRQRFANLTESEIQEMSDKYGIVVIDEAHEGFLKPNNRSYKNMQLLVNEARNKFAIDIKGLLLTATPWNNSREDVIRLPLLFLNIDKVPDSRKYYDYILGGRESALFDSKGDGNFNQEAYKEFWKDYYIQRTRLSLSNEKFLSDKYPKREFPLESEDEPYSIPYSAEVSSALTDALSKLIELHLPYQDTVMQYFNGDSFSQVVLRQRQQLLRRADSSNAAFTQSVENIEIKLKDFITDIDSLAGKSLSDVKKYFIAKVDKDVADSYDDYEGLDLGDNELDEYELNSAKQKRLKLIDDALSQSTVGTYLRQMKQDAESDLIALRDINDNWSVVAKSDMKQTVIINEIRNVVNKGRKVLLFSEYTDTVNDYYDKFLKDNSFATMNIGKISGQGSFVNNTSTTKEEVLGRFSPNSKGYELFSDNEEISVLIGTDAIATGQNLQDATDVMTIELPYNPMKLEQRVGRIDRPKKNGDNRIFVYAFPSDEIIDAEIALTARYENKVEGASADTDADINLPFVQALRKNGVGRALSQAEKEAIQKDNLSSPSLVSEEEARERVQSYYEQIGESFKLSDNLQLKPFSFGLAKSSVFMGHITLRDANGHEVGFEDNNILYNLDGDMIDFVEAESIVNDARKTTISIGNYNPDGFIGKYDAATDSVLIKVSDSFNDNLRQNATVQPQMSYIMDVKKFLDNNKNNYIALFKEQEVDPKKFNEIIKSFPKRSFSKQQSQFLKGLQNSKGKVDSSKVIENVWRNLKQFITIFDMEKLAHFADSKSKSKTSAEESSSELIAGLVALKQ